MTVNVSSFKHSISLIEHSCVYKNIFISFSLIICSIKHSLYSQIILKAKLNTYSISSTCIQWLKKKQRNGPVLFPMFQCSKTCGVGKQKRMVYCGTVDNLVQIERCPGKAPREYNECNLGDCKGIKR